LKSVISLREIVLPNPGLIFVRFSQLSDFYLKVFGSYWNLSYRSFLLFYIDVLVILNRICFIQSS
jgi:hypothetical protein